MTKKVKTTLLDIIDTTPRPFRITQMLGGAEEVRATGPDGPSADHAMDGKSGRPDSTGKYGKRAPGGPTTQMGDYQRPPATSGTVLRIGYNG